MIQLVLSALPIDEVPGAVTLATFFEDVRPLKGPGGLIDWRTNGRLSDLILKGHLSGSFSESLIMPSQGRLSTRDILIFGLGKIKELDEKRFEEGWNKIVDKIVRLKASEIILSFGDMAKDFMGWRALLRLFITSLSLKRPDMQIVCCENQKWINEAKKRNMDFGPEVTVSYS